MIVIMSTTVGQSINLFFPGYTIFVVRGILPECEADQVIALCPVPVPPPVKTGDKKKDKGDKEKKVGLLLLLIFLSWLW